MTSFIQSKGAPGFHTVNIKDDFGAIADGQYNNFSAFTTFNTWARTQTKPITLIIPPGSYFGLDNVAGGGADFFTGIKNLTISGYGATIGGLFGTRGLSFYALGSHAPLTVWAPINTVSSTSTTVTCITPSQASQFSVGNWVCVSSLENQGTGFPPSWYYFDYVQITGINSGTGVITFDKPLNFSHKSTYPDTAVSTFSANGGLYPGSQGGPASVFALASDWDMSLTVQGLTIDVALLPVGSVHTESDLCARYFKCVDCTFTSHVAPSSSLFGSFENCIFNDGGASNYQVEVDKNNSHLRFINCRISLLNMQSASNDVLVDGCHIGTVTGSARRLVMRNTYVSATLQHWPPSTGANQVLSMENCHFANLISPVNLNFINLSDLTFSNGTFSMALTNSKILSMYRFAIPGSKCFFMNNRFVYNFGNPFMITAVYQDSTNVYFDTTLTALPSYSGTFTGNHGIMQHPGARLFAANNTGNDNALMTGKQEDELPIYSYAHKVYSADLGSTQQIQQWGTLVSLKINVIQADTGANGTLTMHPLSQFGTWCVNTSNVTTQFDLTINLKTAGLRTITPTTVTGNVAGDVISAPGSIWFMQFGLQPFISASISGNTPAQMPIVEIELITDQGITSLEYTVQ